MNSVIPDRAEVPAFEVHELAPRRSRYCIGIPVINEGERIRRQLETMCAQGLPGQADIIIADGASRDGSVEPAFLGDVGVRTLLIKRGPGKLSAQLRMLFAYALEQGYEGVVTIDGNNKDGPEAIPAFLAALAEGWDYVQGSRYIEGGYEENTPLARKLGVRYLHAPLLSTASGFHYTDTTNGFRALSRRLLLDPRIRCFRAVFDTYNLHYYLSWCAARLGFRVRELPVRRCYPEQGKTPSKIAGLTGHAQILWQLLRTVTGSYSPRR